MPSYYDLIITQWTCVHCVANSPLKVSVVQVEKVADLSSVLGLNRDGMMTYVTISQIIIRNLS